MDFADFGPLGVLLSDQQISEIMVNGPHEIIVERQGQLQLLQEQFVDEHHLMMVIERLLSSAHVTVNESNPLCDARLPDGSRINVVISPLVLNGPVVTIRRKLRDWTMRDFMATGAISEQAAQFVDGCVKAKVNIVISGGTSTGKTSLVGILGSCIPSGQRIISIENVPELDLPGHLHWIRLVARSANIEGKGELPLRLLVKNALRMRPDRIILGESRGGEALDVVQAMHSGHDGFLTVLHASSPLAALERLETFMLMSGVDLPQAICQMQIASAVDLVIHMARYVDGSRRIASIAQVLGSSRASFQLQELFGFQMSGFAENRTVQGELRYTGVSPKFLGKFQMNNVPIPHWIARATAGGAS